MSVHIGSEIKAVVALSKFHPTRIAEAVGMEKRNFHYLLKRDDLPVRQLYAVGKVLDHDFFSLFPPAELYSEEPVIECGDPMTLHQGELIQSVLEARALTFREAAEQLGMSPRNLQYMVKIESMEVSRLVQLSETLRYDFFRCFRTGKGREDVFSFSVCFEHLISRAGDIAPFLADVSRLAKQRGIRILASDHVQG